MAVDVRDIPLVEPKDALLALGLTVRRLRQREGWTQGDLAKRSGIPETTISRLERTGLVASDSLFRILFALNQLDVVHAFLQERLRLASVPSSLTEMAPKVDVKRVRHRGKPA